MFLFGPPNVEKMKARRDVKGLIKATRYNKDSGHIRQSAVLALVDIGAPAVGPLISALKDKHDTVREAAAETLHKIGTPAVEPLITALKDNSADTRKAAAQILGNIGDLRAIEPLVNALKDAEPNVRVAVAVGLGRLGTERAINPLINTLKDGDSDVRKAAAQALRSIGASAVEQVILELGDSDKDMRLAAARALGEIGDACAVEHLLIALRDDKEPSVRAAAAESLGQIGDRRATQPLITALEDKNDNVGASAAGALGQLGDSCATGPLIDAFNKWVKIGSIGAIEQATKALDKLGYGAVVGPLLPIFQERTLLVLASLVALKEALETTSREESVQKLAVAHKAIEMAGEKEQQIKEQARRISIDLLARYHKESQQPPQSSKVQFPRYNGSGICDVCNRDVKPGEAYLVPVDIFYNSKSYRDWIAKNLPMTMITVDEFIAQSRKMDTTSHSAVCPDCIHMFEKL